MRLFFYYAFHSIINTIKKIFKTWIAIFLGIMIVSTVFGILVGRIVPLVINSVKGETQIEETVEETTEESEKDEDVFFKKKLPDFLDSYDLTKYDLIDVLVTAVFFLIVTMTIAGVNRSGQMFKPADVPILFSSPMKPQSVLMFRLMNSLGGTVIVSLYMLGQVPNLVNNVHLSVWGALAILLGYMLTLMFAMLFQVGAYTIICSTKKGRVNIGGILLGFYALVAVIFIAYVLITGTDVWKAVFVLFANKNTFWVPFWGWIRGMIYYALTGNGLMFFVFLALFVVSCVLIVIFVWNMKVDFYESAMAETERVAEKMANAKSAQTGGTVRREKERSTKIERDGFHYGSGASVFFYKTLYNRFRFAKLKLFNITFMIYLFAGCFTAWLASRIHDLRLDLLFIPAGAIMVCAFYRTLGNPLEEDTSREFFVLIPDSPLKKIWASLLGSTAVCAVDIIVPLIISAIMVRSNPVTMFAWFLFILSVSLFATAVGAFVSLSIPGETAQTLKTMVQTMFVIMGIVPEISFVAIGIIFDTVFIMLLIGTLFNVGIGALFTAFAPKFLENR